MSGLGKRCRSCTGFSFVRTRPRREGGDPAGAFADAVLTCLDRQRRDVNVGALNALTVLGFRAAPAAYDRLVGPLMSRFGMQAGTGVTDTPGNVIDATPEREGLTGGWLAQRPGPTHATTKESDTMDTKDEAHPLGSGGHPLRRTVAASAERVWEVLSDGWSYANWVVGTARIRAVDEHWPAPGARIHHSVGLWPALLSDTTSVEESTAGQRLVLTARGWPFGEARVEVLLEADGPDSCTVTIVEDVASGPGRLPPRLVRQALILPRNSEALRRLALLAEGASGPRGSEDS